MQFYGAAVRGEDMLLVSEYMEVGGWVWVRGWVYGWGGGFGGGQVGPSEGQGLGSLGARGGWECAELCQPVPKPGPPANNM